MDGTETALTTDGTEDLRNGFPDWVYPEELGQYQAFWWSPDSKKIAFMQFDESPVTKYPIVHDVAPMPRYELQGYPVPGANNPIVRLFIVDVATKKIVRLDTGDDLDVYLYRGQWTQRRPGIHLPPPQPVPEQGRALRGRPGHRQDPSLPDRHRPLLHRRIDRPHLPRGQPALPVDLGAERLARDLPLRPRHRASSSSS